MAKHKISVKKLGITTVLIVLTCALVFGLEKNKITNIFDTGNETTEAEKTSSNLSTAQDNFSEGNEREPGNTLSENRGTASVNQNTPPVSSSIYDKKPVTSKNGEIKIFSPSQDSILSKNFQIAGSTTLTKVTFRLIDNVSGLIGTGELEVINGKFSGNLNFETNASEGRIDFYGVKQDGVEFANVEIPVRFK